jgi:hypothetical protein
MKNIGSGGFRNLPKISNHLAFGLALFFVGLSSCTKDVINPDPKHNASNTNRIEVSRPYSPPAPIVDPPSNDPFGEVAPAHPATFKK